MSRSVLMLGRSEGGNASFSIYSSRDCLKAYPFGVSSIKFLILSWIFLLVELDCKCCISWFKCPESVTMDGYRCFFISFSSKLGHDMKCFYLIAFINVLLTDEKDTPCRNCAKFEWVSFFLIIIFILCFLVSGIVP